MSLWTRVQIREHNWIFKKYFSHVDEIFGDVEECYATCHGWMIFMDENVDKNDNGWTFHEYLQHDTFQTKYNKFMLVYYEQFNT
jgi:hypothetical protein